MKLRKIALGAVIAALYAALTLISASFGLAVGPFEFRVSEALTALALLTPVAAPGLFCGCLIANLLCGAAAADVILGSLATLLGAWGTYALRKTPVLALFSPVAANTLVIPILLYSVYGFTDGGLPLLFVTFFVGEAVSVLGLGYPLYRALSPFRKYFQ